MDDYTVLKVSPEMSLPKLQAVVQQEEELVGPLASIGNDGTVTLLTFDLTQGPPQNTTVLMFGDSASRLRGNASTRLGKAFLEGRLEDIVAYRPPVSGMTGSGNPKDGSGTEFG
jgi:hypothetical protein